MADEMVELLVKIPKEKFERIDYVDSLTVKDFIKNAQVLPKGHSRLIAVSDLDVSKLVDSDIEWIKGKCEISKVQNMIDNADTIIEADNSVKEAEEKVFKNLQQYFQFITDKEYLKDTESPEIAQIMGHKILEIGFYTEKNPELQNRDTYVGYMKVYEKDKEIAEKHGLSIEDWATVEYVREFFKRNRPACCEYASYMLKGNIMKAYKSEHFGEMVKLSDKVMKITNDMVYKNGLQYDKTVEDMER